jgi:DNA-directed RNA polymerase subunit RPC12/RpoP
MIPKGTIIKCPECGTKLYRYTEGITGDMNMVYVHMRSMFYYGKQPKMDRYSSARQHCYKCGHSFDMRDLERNTYNYFKYSTEG